jgi:hypothetical protein
VNIHSKTTLQIVISLLTFIASTFPEIELERYGSNDIPPPLPNRYGGISLRAFHAHTPVYLTIFNGGRAIISIQTGRCCCGVECTEGNPGTGNPMPILLRRSRPCLKYGTKSNLVGETRQREWNRISELSKQKREGKNGGLSETGSLGYTHGLVTEQISLVRVFFLFLICILVLCT